MRPVIVSLALALCCAGTAHAQVNGTFRFDNAPTYFPVAPMSVEMHNQGTGVCMLDIDSDGDLDTCRTNGGGWLEFARNDDGVLIALTPALQPPALLGMFAQDVDTLDWDQDGIADLVICGIRKQVPNPLDFAVLRGDGAGKFTPVFQGTVPGTDLFQSIVSLSIADVDGDGKSDAITCAGNAGIAVLRGTGQIAVTALPAKPWIMKVGDFTGDGVPDAITLRWDTFPLTVFEVRTSLGFAFFTKLVATTTTTLQAHGLALGDMDEDGDLDVVTTMGPVTPFPGRADLAVLPNQGGQFGTPIASPCFERWWPAWSIETYDLDQDGHLDAVVSTAEGGGVGEGSMAAARGDGLCGFTDPSTISLFTHEFAIADLRGFGVARIVTADQQVVPFDDDGKIGGLRIDGFIDPLTAGVYVSATPIDVNGDGIQDVVAKDAIGGVARAFVMDGEGGIALQFPVLAAGATSPAFPEWIDRADVNLDALEDVVILNGNSLMALQNLGGAFAPPAYTGSSGCGQNFTAVRRADLDLDGTMDFVVAGNGPCLTAYLGTGTLLFTAVHIALPEPPGSVDLGDLTGDGLPDLVMTGAQTGKVFRLFGTGNSAVFTPPSAAAAFPLAFRGEIRAGDVDGDGDVDAIAYAATTGPQLYVLKNDGQSNFSLGQGFGTGIADPGFPFFPGSALRELNLVDLDGDGDLDVFVRRQHAWEPFGTIEFAENDAGTFKDANPGVEIFGTDSSSVPRMDLRSGDFDGDGLDDLLVSGFAPFGDASFPAIYLNRSRLASEGRAQGGGRVHFDLRDPTAPNKPYVILLSTQGAWPGFFLGAHVPLNYDPVLVPMIASAIAPGVFVHFIGTLDAKGRAAADLMLPPFPALASVLELDAAALIVDPVVSFTFRSTNQLRVRVH